MPSLGTIPLLSETKKAEMYCDSIPRVYSGVSYDFCKLHGALAPVHAWSISTAAPGSMFDMLSSGVRDTVVPLTRSIGKVGMHHSQIIPLGRLAQARVRDSQ